MKKLRQQLEDRVEFIEQAYEEANRPRVDFSVYPEDIRSNRENNYHAVVLVEAARKIERENGLGEIDWSNPNQYKYAPWFRMNPSAFVFRGSDCVRSDATAGSGSRLRVLDRTTSDYLGEKFPEVWKEVQLG